MAGNGTENNVPLKDTPGFVGDRTLHLNTALIVCTTVVIVLRLYVRSFMSNALGVDDLLAFLTFGLLIALSAMEIRLTQTLIYLLATGMMRLSIAAFLPRLSQDKNYLTLVYITGFLTVAQMVGFFFYLLTECSPISDIWKPRFLPRVNCVPPESDDAMMVAHQVVNLILDFALMILPIWVVYTKMLFSKRAFQVILVFSMGIFVIITGCIRLAMMKSSMFLTDPTFNMSTIGSWTDLEGHVGLWVASFPALQPLVRIISFELGLGSKLYSYMKHDRSNTGGGSGINARPGVRNGVARSKGEIRNGSGVDSVESLSERGLAFKHDEKVELDETNTSGSRIHRQIDVEVRVDRASAFKGHSTYTPGESSNN